MKRFATILAFMLIGTFAFASIDSETVELDNTTAVILTETLNQIEEIDKLTYEQKALIAVTIQQEIEAQKNEAGSACAALGEAVESVLLALGYDEDTAAAVGAIVTILCTVMM